MLAQAYICFYRKHHFNVVRKTCHATFMMIKKVRTTTPDIPYTGENDLNRKRMILCKFSTNGMAEFERWTSGFDD